MAGQDALGALLLEQGRTAQAERVYREELGLGATLPRAQIHPDNLWALRGLLDCLQQRGEIAETALVRQRLDFAVPRADRPVSVSCFCAGNNRTSTVSDAAAALARLTPSPSPS